MAEREPLGAPEWLELMAAGEVLARYYRHPTTLDHAMKAGATWDQIGAARGTSPARRAPTTANGPRVSTGCGPTTAKATATDSAWTTPSTPRRWRGWQTRATRRTSVTRPALAFGQEGGSWKAGQVLGGYEGPAVSPETHGGLEAGQ